MHSPYDMLGMDVAVARLEAAIARKEDVLIYGDYERRRHHRHRHSQDQ